MALNIKLSPETLKMQASAMTRMKSNYESIENSVVSSLRAADAAWSKNLSASFSSIMDAQIQKMNGYAQQLELGIQAAQFAADSIGSADAELANTLDTKLAALMHQPKIPQVQKGDGTSIYDVYGNCGSVSSINKYDDGSTSISCTYYTLQRIRQEGLEYPFLEAHGDLNGKNWVSNCAAETKATGPDAIQELVNRYDVPLKNVVVSFDPNVEHYDGNINYCGHVNFINEIYKDANGNIRIKYSDMVNYDNGQLLRDTSSDAVRNWNASHENDISYEKFKARFGGYPNYTPVNGAVYLGSSKT